MLITHVEDDETLYRRVVYKMDNWHVDESGVLRVTQTAFSDPQNKPSVVSRSRQIMREQPHMDATGRRPQWNRLPVNF